jgi:hypothetical protein
VKQQRLFGKKIRRKAKRMKVLFGNQQEMMHGIGVDLICKTIIW